jgi:hypothetical protein
MMINQHEQSDLLALYTEEDAFSGLLLRSLKDEAGILKDRSRVSTRIWQCLSRSACRTNENPGLSRDPKSKIEASLGSMRLSLHEEVMPLR